MENQIKNSDELTLWKYRSWGLEIETQQLISSLIKTYNRIAMVAHVNDVDREIIENTMFFIEADLKPVGVFKIGTHGEEMNDRHFAFNNNDTNAPGLTGNFYIVCPAWIREINGDTFVLEHGIGEQL